MQKEKEIWKDIKNYEKLYQISNHGRIKALEKIIINCWNVKRKYKEKILINYIAKTKYAYINLTRNKFDKKTFRIHRLVAQHFINNPKNKPHINHKNGNKKNNYYMNLEWVTPSENMRHAYKNNLSNRIKKCSIYNKDNQFIKEFKSRVEAGKWRKVLPEMISHYIYDNCKDPKGYIWKNILEKEVK